MGLEALWPKVRIGYQVKLKTGEVGEVVSVVPARDILKYKTEFEAIMMGPPLQAIYGSQWIDFYYEATVHLEDSFEQKVVTPNDIDRVVSC